MKDTVIDDGKHKDVLFKGFYNLVTHTTNGATFWYHICHYILAPLRVPLSEWIWVSPPPHLYMALFELFRLFENITVGWWLSFACEISPPSEDWENLDNSNHPQT